MTRPSLWCIISVACAAIAFVVGQRLGNMFAAPVVVRQWVAIAGIVYPSGYGYGHRIAFTENDVPPKPSCESIDVGEAADWDVVYNVRLRHLRRELPHWTSDAMAGDMMLEAGLGFDNYVLKVAPGHLRLDGLSREIDPNQEYVIVFPEPAPRAFRFEAANEGAAHEKAVAIIWHEDSKFMETIIRQSQDDLARLGRPIPE